MAWVSQRGVRTPLLGPEGELVSDMPPGHPSPKPRVDINNAIITEVTCTLGYCIRIIGMCYGSDNFTHTQETKKHIHDAALNAAALY